MSKEFLLARSHFKKNRGTSIGLLSLILLAATLLTISLLTIFDAYPTSAKEGKRLNGGDGFLTLSFDMEGISEDVLNGILTKYTTEHEIHRGLEYQSISVPFGNGEMVIDLHFMAADAYEAELGRIEIIDEDPTITSDYIYLPYQYYTSGSTKIGDTFEFSMKGNKESFKVRGFLNSTYGACNNTGLFIFFVDPASYDRLMERDGASEAAFMVVYKLKEGVKNSAFYIAFTNAVKTINSRTQVGGSSFDDAIYFRSFMSLIIAISFIVVSAIILIVIILMLANSIANFIRENMKTIGSLKAIGYTGADIRNSLLIQFLTLAVAGSIAGIALGYLAMPVVAGIVIAQMGMPYSVSFNVLATICPVIFILLFVLLVTMLASRKIGKIDPIIALRDGLAGHNFKKNHVRLDRSGLGVNTSLALKTMFANRKQNIITFFVVGFIMFVCTIGLMMYENFSRNPKLDFLYAERCSGVLGVNSEKKAEAKEYLENRTDVSNVRRALNIHLYYGAEDHLFTFIFDDTDKMNNKNVCYKGRLPKHDNEITVSGKFADEQDLEIGDEIKLNYGAKTASYVITGFMQTVNNLGHEAIMSEAAASHLMDFERAPGYLWFDCDGKDKTNEIFRDAEAEFEGYILSTMNYYEVLDGALTTFQSISLLMLILVCVISAIVILLVLFLLVKSLLYNKRKDYGIYKALGYTSNSLILQTAISFMPSIILSVLIFSVVSFYAANPYLNIFLSSFGIVKSAFDIPIPGLVLIGVGVIVLAFLFSVWQARRIRKIEAYNMLLAE
ncbi:MAG: ABC transporter permease [Lachnospiraceae bacterium]|nr:ABC transporter permease [Lachnospiraceae bacterium]